MSLDPAAAALGGLGCGAAGLLVPALIGRIPEPEPDPAHPKPAYAAVAAGRGLPAVASAWCLVAGALVGAAVGLAWPLLVVLPLVPVGVALAVVDLRTRLLPTAVIRPTLLGTAALACVSAWLDGDGEALVRAVIGAAAVFGFFFALWWIHPAGMGFGDVRLSAVLGLALSYLGWAEVLVGVYAAFLTFAVPGLVIALLRRNRGVLRTSYAFGPFLLAGALAGVVLGDPLWSGLVSG